MRDADGRTYAAATVDLPSLQLSAVQVCVAMAVASGSKGLQAAVLLGEAGELTAAGPWPRWPTSAGRVSSSISVTREARQRVDHDLTLKPRTDLFARE